MSKFIVKQNLNHDGNNYADGDEIEMTDKQAAPLIELGVLGKKKKPTGPTRPTDGAALNAAIVAAINTLDKAKPELWTKDGSKPQVAGIEAVLKYQISAAERDAALALPRPPLKP